MTRTCEHCAFWKGNENSSRADCGHAETIGTTSFDDTCKHFNAKAWASNPAPDKIDENGKIKHWGRGLTFAGVDYGTYGPKDDVDKSTNDIINDFLVSIAGAYKLPDHIALSNPHQVMYYDNTPSHQTTKSITELLGDLRDHARRMNMTLMELIGWAEK